MSLIPLDQLRRLETQEIVKRDPELLAAFDNWRFTFENPYPNCLNINPPFRAKIGSKGVMVVPLAYNEIEEREEGWVKWGVFGVGYILVDLTTLVVIERSDVDVMLSLVRKRKLEEKFDCYHILE